MFWTNSYSLQQTGAFIKKVRKEKGLSQSAFAEMLGVSHATLSALENGKSVSSKTLLDALSFLGLKLVILPKSAQAVVTISEDDRTNATIANNDNDKEERS